MKIIKVKLQDFRTFYGSHTIELSTSDERPLTIFIGENGSGKTTLLNAIYWCFTGNTSKQFSESSVLINKDAKQEGKRRCTVELDFEAEGQRYTLTRHSTGDTTTAELTLGQYDKSRAYTSIGVSHIKNIIERYIPEKLANWYLFDGEAIGYLHLNGDPNFKKDLQQTFGFTEIAELINVLHEIKRDYEKELTRQIADSELSALKEEKDSLEVAIEIFDQQIIRLNQTRDNALSSIESLEYQLSRFDKSEPLQSRISVAQNKINQYQVALNKKISDKKSFIINTMPQIIMQRNFTALTDILNGKEIEQTLPEPFGTQLIDQIQREMVCICGNAVLPGTEAYDRVESNRARAASGKHIHKISLIRSQMSKYLSDASGFQERYSSLSSEIATLESEIAEQHQIIKAADQRLQIIPDEQIRTIKDKLTEAQSIRDRAIGDLAVSIDRRDDSKVKLIKLENKVSALIASLSRNTKLEAQKNRIEALWSYLSEQYTEQENDVLKALNDEISGVLDKYLTKNFKARVDPTSYSVKIFDLDDRPVTMSTGETNLLKFAVIAAIVGMAGHRTTISHVNWLSQPIIAPLIFDAPFSVVDQIYRAGIANNLSSLASQLIFLFDSDKWDSQLSELLMNRVGKMYTLISKAKGKEKTTVKFIELSGDLIQLNEYDSPRDESECREVLI